MIKHRIVGLRVEFSIAKNQDYPKQPKKQTQIYQLDLQLNVEVLVVKPYLL
jgi:hypothetical protein